MHEEGSDASDASGASGAMMRYRATLAYDGTEFAGFQSQRGVRTVQDVVESALAELFTTSVRIAGAGRTDAGVHARGQVIAFDVIPHPSLMEPARLLRACNSVLPHDVRVLEVAMAAVDFDPRRQATRRIYRYRIWNREVDCPIERRFSWHVRHPLDDAAMADAAAVLVGEHDFTSFQGSDRVERSGVRRLMVSRVTRDGCLVEYRVEANAFVRHMVRNLVGALVAAGRGRLSAADLRALLAARDRRRAPPVAPAQGLFLEAVEYDENEGRAGP